MSILKNAADSISLGVDDYLMSFEDPRRVLSCTRNLYAGVLLLFKEKLVRLSPQGSREVLIRKRIRPLRDDSGTIHWHGEGQETVGLDQIGDRFKSLGISVDWRRVTKIRYYRNDIEHYFSRESPSSAQAMLCDCFLVIRDFMRSHLHEDPLEIFGANAWKTLITVAEVYEKEREECAAALDGVEWEYSELRAAVLDFRCETCGSGLIDVDQKGLDKWHTSFRCRSCGEKWDFEALAGKSCEDYLPNCYQWEHYLSVTDGNDPPTIECPSCGRYTYLLEDDHCLVCGESTARLCARCSVAIPASEIDGTGFCSYCAHIMSKED